MEIPTNLIKTNVSPETAAARIERKRAYARAYQRRIRELAAQAGLPMGVGRHRLPGLAEMAAAESNDAATAA